MSNLTRKATLMVPSLSSGKRDPLAQALQILARMVGIVIPSVRPTPISLFKASYTSVLKQADENGVALISQGAKRYVIVSEDRIIALSVTDRRERTVADLVESLPRPTRRIDPERVHVPGAVNDIALPALRG
jgi:hypothetical protein